MMEGYHVGSSRDVRFDVAIGVTAEIMCAAAEQSAPQRNDADLDIAGPQPD